jgi:dihydropteroate synthase-like protein
MRKVERMTKSRGNRVLVITGRLCEAPILSLLRDENVDVVSVPVDVATLITSRQVVDALKGRDVSQYDFALLPGMFRQDVESLAREMGIPTFLGPVHYVDIPLVLQKLQPEDLSTHQPADRVLTQHLRKRTDDFYVDACRFPASPPDGAIVIGSGETRLVLTHESPPRVIGEVVDAPRKGYYTIIKEAKQMVSAGAELVDIGMIPSEDNLDFLASTLPQIKKEIKVPISVDTMRTEEILQAVEYGADLILSLCGSTIELAESISIPFVLVPLESPDMRPPATAEDRLALLSTYVRRLEGTPVILDPLLMPIGHGMGESLKAYCRLGDALPGRPSLMGVGNVVEMTDADSVGMNALLGAIACENGVQLLLATENSPKTRGSIGELASACKMMYYAVRQGFAPMNIGIDLLRLKEKRLIDSPVRIPSLRIRASEAAETASTTQQDATFQIVIKDGVIHLIRHLPGKDVDIIGRHAIDIGAELANRGWLPSPSHSLYLGLELSKAETALRTGRNYIQDQPLFPGWDSSEEDQD